MAISKIHPIRYSVLDAINYITDKTKTDSLLVSSFACGVHTADLEFADTYSRGFKRGDVKAQHLIQAFAPGEVDAATAHEIGKKLINELTDGKHEYIIATHTDKDHIHNHIIFNNVSFVDYKKFRQNISTFHHMQEINDKLCQQYGLSVIKDRSTKVKTYYEYKELKNNTSNRQVFRNSIDACIPLVSSFDELLVMLNNLGYKEKQTGNSYSFIKDDWQRAVRLKTLGDNYSYEQLVQRIKFNSYGATPHVFKNNNELSLLSELSTKMSQYKSPAYANKVAISDVKRVAATYAFLNERGINSVSEIDKKLSEWSLEIKNKRNEIRTLEQDIGSLSELMTYASNKEKYGQINVAYKKSKDNPDFFKAHRRELILYEAACKALSLNNISSDTTYEMLKQQLDDMTSKKNALLDSYHKLISEEKQLNVAKKNIDIILAKNKEQSATKNRNKNI